MFQTSLRDKVKRIQELRRSNAAQPVRNKKKYTRKIKHKNKVIIATHPNERLPHVQYLLRSAE